jgi:hypothetical protein
VEAGGHFTSVGKLPLICRIVICVERSNAVPKDIPWKRAIEQVLREAKGPMHYKDIAEKIVSDGLRTERIGATPAATVSARLTTSVKNEGAHSPS